MAVICTRKAILTKTLGKVDVMHLLSAAEEILCWGFIVPKQRHGSETCRRLHLNLLLSDSAWGLYNTHPGRVPGSLLVNFFERHGMQMCSIHMLITYTRQTQLSSAVKAQNPDAQTAVVSLTSYLQKCCILYKEEVLHCTSSVFSVVKPGRRDKWCQQQRMCLGWTEIFYWTPLGWKGFL